MEGVAGNGTGPDGHPGNFKNINNLSQPTGYNLYIQACVFSGPPPERKQTGMPITPTTNIGSEPLAVHLLTANVYKGIRTGKKEIQLIRFCWWYRLYLAWDLMCGWNCTAIAALWWEPSLNPRWFAYGITQPKSPKDHLDKVLNKVLKVIISKCQIRFLNQSAILHNTPLGVEVAHSHLKYLGIKIQKAQSSLDS